MITYVKTVLSLLLLGLLSSGTSVGVAEDQTEPRFEIRLKNISATSVVSLVADLGRLNIVAGDELKSKRVDVVERSLSLQQLLSRITKDQNLVTRLDRGILLIGSQCRLSTFSEFPDQTAFRKPISVYFQSAASKVLTEVFAKVTGAPVNVLEINVQVPATLRLKDTSARDYMGAVATVQGWSVLLENGGIKFVPNGQLKKCGAPAVGFGTKIETAIASKLWTADRPCRVPTRKKCMPLEYYNLEELRPLGYIQSLSNPARFAIFEARDGLVYLARVGDYMGVNFGTILRITPTGLVIIELIQGPDGKWDEQLKTINYQ